MKMASGFLRFLVFLIHLIKEFLHGKVVDRKQFAKALDGDVCLSFFNAPVLHPRQIEIVGKVFMATVTFLLAQIGQFRSDTGECVI